MRGKNIVWLEGALKDEVQYRKSSEGKEYATFVLEIANVTDKIGGSTNERAGQLVYIRVMVFDKHLLQYMRDMDVKSNDWISLFGRLNAYFSNFNGKMNYQMDVVVRDLSVLKKRYKYNGKNI